MFTSVTYPGISLNDNPNFHLTGVSGLSNPGIRRESYDMPQADFGIYIESRYGERAFSLEGILVASTATELVDLRDQMGAAFSIYGAERELKFSYSDRPDRSIFCVASDVVQFDPTSQMPFAVNFRVPMVASFPFLRSSQSTTLTLDLTTEGGAAIPAEIPLGLSMGSGGSAFAINSGTAPAILTARFLGGADNPALRNLTTGEEIALSTTLGTGEWIDVNFQLGQLRDQDGRNRYDSFRGTFFKLPVGTSELRVVANTYSPETKVQVGFASTYLSL